MSFNKRNDDFSDVVCSVLTLSNMFDGSMDEYLVPMGNLTSVHPLFDKLDAEGNKIISFGSSRAWARRQFIEYVIYFRHGN